MPHDSQAESGSAGSARAPLASPSARRRRYAGAAPARSQSLDAANGNNGFMSNDELGAEDVRPARAPDDPRPDGTGSEEPEGPCFMCRFCPSKRCSGDAASTEWGAQEFSDAYDDLKRLIDKYHVGTGGECILLDDLVGMIEEFYRREIQQFYDYGNWSRRSIYNHLVFHTRNEDQQISENLHMLFLQIQSLRERSWSVDNQTGILEPNLKIIHTLDKLTKSHAEQAKAKRQRMLGK